MLELILAQKASRRTRDSRVLTTRGALEKASLFRRKQETERAGGERQSNPSTKLSGHALRGVLGVTKEGQRTVRVRGLLRKFQKEKYSAART